MESYLNFRYHLLDDDDYDDFDDFEDDEDDWDEEE